MKAFLPTQSFAKLLTQKSEGSSVYEITHPNARRSKIAAQLAKNEGDLLLPENEPLEIKSENPRRLRQFPSSTLEESKDSQLVSETNCQKKPQTLPQLHCRLSDPLPKKVPRWLYNPYILTKHSPEEEARLDEIRKKILREDRRMEEILMSRRIPLSKKSMFQLARFKNNGKIEEKY